MTSLATSVVSAAVIGGELIIGLSDGSIINCGSVSGPQGLKGDQGPMGATGRSGTDGNTIHTVAGTPDTTLGRDGDFAINVTVWEIYGPRAGGAWGTGTPLRGNKRGGGAEKQALFGNNSSSEGGGGVNQTTATLPLSNPTRLSGARGLPDTNGLKSQADYNQWAYDSLESLAAGVSPEVDLSSYAKTDYVDQADNALSGRIQAVEQDYTTSDEFSTLYQQVTTNKNDIKALQSRIATLEQQVSTLVELVPPVDYGTVTVSGGNDFNAENHACWLPQNDTGVFTCSLSGSQIHGCRYKWTISRGSGRISGADNLSVVTMQCTDPAPNTVVLRCDVSHPTTEEVTHGEVQILVQSLD